MLNSSAQPTTAPRTVLVVEDEPTLATAIAQRITAEGWTARVASDGASAVQAATTLRPDLVIMDIMLPVMDGLEATKRIVAERPVPVLILTARDDEADKVIGLGAGADDYMTKPPDKTELLLRIKALLRRARIVDEHKITVGDVVVDMDSRTVRRGMEVQTLPPKEFELLYKLLAYPERTFTRMELLDEIWGIDTVNVHINRLRNRFYDWPEFEIQTVRGLGYRAVKKV